MEKVQWNSIDKKQNGLKYSKNDKSSTLPRYKVISPYNYDRIIHNIKKNAMRQDIGQTSGKMHLKKKEP